jgi:hypothetical protein
MDGVAALREVPEKLHVFSLASASFEPRRSSNCTWPSATATHECNERETTNISPGR